MYRCKYGFRRKYVFSGGKQLLWGFLDLPFEIFPTLSFDGAEMVESCSFKIHHFPTFLYCHEKAADTTVLCKYAYSTASRKHYVP